MTAVVIGIIASILSGVVWWMTNRLPNRSESGKDAIDAEKKRVDDEIDKWANR